MKSTPNLTEATAPSRGSPRRTISLASCITSALRFMALLLRGGLLLLSALLRCAAARRAAALLSIGRRDAAGGGAVWRCRSDAQKQPA